MKNTFFVAIFATTSAFATSTLAESVIASDPQTVLKYFEDIGAPATIGEDNVGDPLVTFQYYGTDMAVYFYGCHEAKNCNSIQFFAGYTPESEISMEAINLWNAENRYARAYEAENGGKRLEYDIYTGNAGVSADDFDEMFDLWTELVKDFEDKMS
ncbi:YbjN domain-containing protein [Aliiroseovarius sp. 2305UL8-7]|uniref:YbjN domain-containing protein n=1 Tax=Aliiroseovarius conchicola TaxID=3121637 RepID=UPI003527B918